MALNKPDCYDSFALLYIVVLVGSTKNNQILILRQSVNQVLIKSNLLLLLKMFDRCGLKI